MKISDLSNNKKRRKTEKELQHFQEIKLSDDEQSIFSQESEKSMESRKCRPLVLNET